MANYRNENKLKDKNTGKKAKLRKLFLDFLLIN
jgi:hypothetical protein